MNRQNLHVSPTGRYEFRCRFCHARFQEAWSIDKHEPACPTLIAWNRKTRPALVRDLAAFIQTVGLEKKTGELK